MQHLRYPNESNEYRAARSALLDDEIALRAQIEAVAAKRRALPLGGEVPEDYVFERIGRNSMPENSMMSTPRRGGSNGNAATASTTQATIT